MPVTDLLKAQRLTYEVGILRTGVRRPDGAPMTIDTFRFTSASRAAIAAVAEMYGGTARPWDNRGHAQHEVITEAHELLVTVPPDIGSISMWYEMWTAGGCQRRCDSEKEQKSGSPCLCAPLLLKVPEEDRGKERARLAGLKTPKACALMTRVSVILPDLPDVGTWRLNTKSYFGTLGLVYKLRIMEAARAQGVFLPARLWIDHQSHVTDGQTRRYPVPVLELLNTPRQIATGQLEGGLAAQLPPAPGEQPRAITSGAPRPPASEPAAPPAPARTADNIVADAWQATTREDIEALAAEAKELRVAEDHVCVSGDAEMEVFEELNDFLKERWKAMRPSGGKG